MSDHNLILAIDPGTERSAWVLYDRDSDRPVAFDIVGNANLVTMLDYKSNACVLSKIARDHWHRTDDATLVIEMVACYGMPVGAQTFETCVWIGRFIQAWLPKEADRVFRKDVKLHLCGSARAKDANVRQALIDKFGPGKSKAIGLKKTPGPLYGIKSHLWAALAVAVTFTETNECNTT